MVFKHYKHLNVPDTWERYFTKYPQGMSILESLFEWVSQVDSMVDNQNKLNANVEQFRKEIDDFVGRFDERLQVEVINTLNEWQNSGFLDVVISEALQWQLDDYIATNEQDKVSINQQLQQTSDKLRLKTYKKYGEVELPNDFWVRRFPFRIWRNHQTGLFEHNFKIDEEGFETRYVRIGGSHENDGLTPETAWGTLVNAIQHCEASAGNGFIINFVGHLDRRMNFITTETPLTKQYIFRSEQPVASNELVSEFTLTGNQIYQTAMAYDPVAVVRIDERANGLPFELARVESLSDLESVTNSYFYDTVNKILHVRKNGTTPENTYVIVSSTSWQMQLNTNGRIVLDGIEILTGINSQSLYFTKNSGYSPRLFLNNVKSVQYSKTGNTANGIGTNGITETYLFNCMVKNIRRDGFNYHNTVDNSGGGYVFEYYCFAENTGHLTDTTNNNISTAHEGMHVLRVGTKGKKSKGPLIADVNGCYSINIDVEVFETGLELLNNQNTGFYFDDTPNQQIPNPNGKAYLISCGSGSNTEWGINSDTSFKKPNKLFVDNFKGVHLPEDLVITALY